jgi:hypothetical protein
MSNLPPAPASPSIPAPELVQTPSAPPRANPQVLPGTLSIDPLDELLSRPAFERAREYRYRFGQSVVFGLPVLALQFWGPGLGGREAVKWVGIFQALLAGWIVYVAAAGMLFEGILLLRRRVTADLICSTAALAVYGLSGVRLVQILIGSATARRPIFHVVVLILAAWSGARWWQYGRHAGRPSARG